MSEPHIARDGSPPTTDAKPDTVVANLPHRPARSSRRPEPSTLPGKSPECQAAPGNRGGATRPRQATRSSPTFRARSGDGCGGTCTGPLCSLHMRGFVRRCAAIGVFACAAAAHAQSTEVFPVSKVQRGQTGYGLTTFAGTKPERFTFEVVSVVKNFLPKQDIILVKSDDPKMAVSGFWQGMSGSPLYIDDKLVCAFSYGFRFNKIALGGCTPIEYMKREADAVRRGKVVQAAGVAYKTVQPMAASLEDWRRLTPKVDAAEAMAALGPTRRSWLLSAPLPSPVTRPAAVDDQVMTASVPLSISGFSAPAFGQLSKLFGDSNLVPMRAGGSGSA